jgi:outer membrane protein OmpA-like peptidoglycan-associated protein
MSLRQPPPAPPPPSKAWMVFFDTNSTTLSQQATMTITEAVNVAKSMPNARVAVTGYTDTDGSPAYNQQLSIRRADAVKNALVSNGIAPQAISVNGTGEAGLLIDTPDQTKNEKNRRVQIVVQ